MSIQLVLCYQNVTFILGFCYSIYLKKEFQQFFFPKKNHVTIFVYWCKMTSCMMLKRPTNISQCSILSKKCTFDNRIFFEYWWKILCFSLWRLLNFDAWWIFQIGDLENFLVAHLLHIFDQKNITCNTESKQMLLKFQNTCNSIFFARCYGKTTILIMIYRFNYFRINDSETHFMYFSP